MDDDVEEHLQGLLAVAFASGRRLQAAEHAAFCLLAARRFCREHREGFWTWDSIRIPLGDTQRSYQQVCKSVESGLLWWGRSLVITSFGRQYLASLVCEGGLPLSLLKRQGDYLRRFFKHVLRDKERFPASLADELCRRHEADLPKTLRNDCVFGLASRLVESVVEIREELGSDRKITVATLDRERPEWRDKVPLRLADGTAVELLNLLLSAPSSARASRDRFGVDIVLQNDQEHSLCLVPHFPIELDLDDFAGRFGLAPNKIPERFRVSLEDGLSKALVSVTVYRAGAESGQLVRFGSSPATRITCAPDDEFRWTMHLAGQRLGQAEVEGGVPSNAAPWTFVDNGGDNLLRGEGSVTTRREVAIVALPRGQRLELDHGGFLAAGRIAAFDRELFEVRGGVTVVDDDDDCLHEIVSGSKMESLSRFSLQGTRFDSSVVGTEVWRGAPRIVEIDEDGHRKEVKPECVEFRGAHGGSWVSGAIEPWGDVSLHVRRGGKILFRRRTCVLPADFAIELHPGKAVGQGSIAIKGLGIRDLTVHAEAGVEASIATDDESTFEITLKSRPGASSDVEVDVRLPRGAARLVLPFPAKDAGFLDGVGQVLPSESRISLGRLSGVRARAFSPDPSDRFVLVATPGRGGVLAELQRLEGAMHELVLDRLVDRIDELLSRGTDADPSVRLQVEARAGLVQQGAHRLNVHRYDVALECATDEAEGHFVIRPEESREITISAADLDQVVIEAIPVFDPAREPVPFTKSEDLEWTLPIADLEPGAWIVRGMIGDWLSARPTFLGARLSERPLGDSVLVQAMHAKPADIDEAMSAALALLVEDPENEDWKLIGAAMASARTMPAHTFMVNRALQKQPTALAIAVLQNVSGGQVGEVWEAFESSRFLWCNVPIESWRTAADRVLGKILAIEVDGLDSRTLVESILEKLAAISHFAKIISGYLRHFMSPREIAPDGEFEQYARAAVRKKSWDIRCEGDDGARQGLYRMHADESWPRLDLRSLRKRLEGLDRHFGAMPSANDDSEFRSEVLDAPVLAAGAVALGVALEDREIETLREARFFDREWFESVQAWSLGLILGSMIEKEGDEGHAIS